MTSTAPTCACCGKPLADGAYACVTCGITKPGEQLRTLADMVPAARDIAHGLSRRGGEGAGGKPGSRLPLDLGATSRLDAVEAVLTKWVDHIGPIRGHTRPWFTHTGDPINIAATWLTPQLEWMRHRPDQEPDEDGNTWGAQQFLADVAAAARVVAGIARGPSAQRYLGPCGAEIDVPECNPIRHAPDCPEDCGIRQFCDGDIYAREGASTGRCRTCGAEVSTDLRRAWLDGEVRAHAFTARDIADAHGINVKTIRTWATRGVLASYWRTEGGLVTPWVNTDDEDEIQARGGRLHYVGDVLDLAAADAARRAEQQATRARRAAARAAESERMSA